jgi:hypothetical protein
MTTKTTTAPMRDQSRTGKALIALINHLESQLKHPDTVIATKAASDLKEILLADAERKEKSAERALHAADLEARKALSVPPPVDRDLLIARLQSEIAQRGNA